jgi:FAD/FMN-containing dehydrogenase
MIKRNNRVPEGTERKPIGRFKHWLDDEFLSNTAFGAINRVVASQRSWIPKVNNLAASMLSAREYTDDSYNVFVSPRSVRFRESEFAMPREALNDVLGELKKWFDAGHERISFPIEVRFAAADDIWLSTAQGRATGYIAVHRFWKDDPTEYFREVEAIMRDHEGRPHWGKMHNRSADDLRPVYPHFDDFLAVRDRLDPDRLFANPYLTRVLGA